jgi:dTDP-4-amino-4,6-dideoxygalactose transaminase
MYHDVLGGIRTNTPLERILPGFNLRMGELQGALLRVQNGRLDQIIRDCRTNREKIASATAAVFEKKGVIARHENDPAGDIGVALTFLLPGAERLAIIAAALRMEGVPVRPFLLTGNPDAHVYCAWLPLFHKNTWSKRGRPWAGHPRSIEYDANMCPQTLGILGRALCVDISPDLTADHIEQIAEAVTKVLDVAL